MIAEGNNDLVARRWRKLHEALQQLNRSERLRTFVDQPAL